MGLSSQSGCRWLTWAQAGPAARVGRHGAGPAGDRPAPRAPHRPGSSSRGAPSETTSRAVAKAMRASPGTPIPARGPPGPAALTPPARRASLRCMPRPGPARRGEPDARAVASQAPRAGRVAGRSGGRPHSVAPARHRSAARPAALTDGPGAGPRERADPSAAYRSAGGSAPCRRPVPDLRSRRRHGDPRRGSRPAGGGGGSAPEGAFHPAGRVLPGRRPSHRARRARRSKRHTWPPNAH